MNQLIKYVLTVGLVVGWWVPNVALLLGRCLASACNLLIPPVHAFDAAWDVCRSHERTRASRLLKLKLMRDGFARAAYSNWKAVDSN